MKKILFTLAFMALLLTGCQKEKFEGSSDNGGETIEVSFTAMLEKAEATRAVADNDGHAANVNHWVLQVYEAGENGALFYEEKRDVTAGTLTQTYELKLFKNQSYNLLFWADTKDAYDTEDLRTVSPKDFVANKDSRDAFSARKLNYKSEVSESKSITLTRPFAQLNIITCDLDELKAKVIPLTYPKYIPKNLQVVATIPTTFNVQTQEAGTPTSKTLKADVSYGGEEKFGAGATETTLFMDYIFASKVQADVRDIKFSFKSNENLVEYDFANIPLQRNYRTNIKGKLMSNDSEWTVTIDPEWNTPEYVEELWAAGMVTPVTPVEDVYTINRPSELAWIAQQVNAGNTFTGKTVKLAKDIDLNNGEWTPMGGVTSYPSNAFFGTLDGNNHKILNLNCSDKTKKHAAAALIGGGCCTVKNLTIENVKVSSTHYAAALVGYASTNGGTLTIENCQVKNGTITSTPEWLGTEYDNGDKVGGLVGYCANACKISGCIVEGLAIKAYRDLGGIAGAAKCAEIKNNTVKNCTITADQTVNFYDISAVNAGAIVGRALEGTVDESNTAENVAVSYSLSDGLSFNPEAKELVVSNAKGLDAVRNFLTSDYCTNADYRIYDSYSTVLFTIKLMNDITLTDAWTPIATADNQSIHFNGNGKKISGLNISGANYAGLFEGGRDKENEFDFKKLTIDGASITGVAGQYAGAFMAWGGKVFHFEDCTLTNSSVTAAKYTAGLVGFSNAPYTGFKNLTVSGCTITGAHDRATGGIIGHNQGENDITFDMVVVSNTAITSTVDGASVGGIIGRFGVAGRNDVLHYINCSVNGAATAEAFCGQRLDNGAVDIQ